MIIVLCGVRGSGKDTIGDLLVANHGFQKTSFARPLKEMAKRAFPAFTEENLYGSSEKREEQYPQYPFSGTCVACGADCRQVTGDPHAEDHWCCTQCFRSYPLFINARIALQTLGTEWGRRLYRDVWIDAAFGAMQQARQHWKVANFGALYGKAGLRPSPEPHFVVTDGRFRNEVERSFALGGKTVLLTRGLEQSTDTHPSEAELRTLKPHEFSYVFDNARLTLEQLPEHITKMLEHFEGRS